jgi:hypothetical protein
VVVLLALVLLLVGAGDAFIRQYRLAASAEPGAPCSGGGT